MHKNDHGHAVERQAEWHKTGHTDEDQAHTAEGYPYMCTGEILLAMINVYQGVVIGTDAAAAVQVLARLSVNPSKALEHVLDIARRSPADEATGRSKATNMVRGS